MENLSRYVELGIVHFMAFPETIRGEKGILESIRKILLDDDFKVIEVTWIKDPKIRKEAAELFDQSGIKVLYAAQPRVLLQGLNPNALNEEERKRAVEDLKKGIDEAIEIGAKGFAFLAGKDPGPEKRSEAKKQLIKTISELCDYARSREKDLMVELEIFDREIDKKALIGPSREAAEVAKIVRKEHSNFGLLHDLSHLPLLGESPREALEPIKKYLTHIHIGSCVLDPSHEAYGDKHPRFQLKGSEVDVYDLRDFLKTLFDIGYLGGEPKVVSFEVSPRPGEDPELVIASSKRFLWRAWSTLKIP
ncbi:MAG: sugar phosphate isomerase/epimerase [Thaumarchaeota archaeon]|nr:MAG: sugar phosphate isomerase/epimerase [Nitrososphaerota archaeon]